MMYMIEIILLNQSKLSLLGVIRQILYLLRSFVWLCLITSTIFNVTYAVCYLHIKQIAISQERRAIWKNYRWSSFIISRVLSNKTNLIFISYTDIHFKRHGMLNVVYEKRMLNDERNYVILACIFALIPLAVK